MKKSFDLFLLMFNLSQLNDSERIIDLYMEGMGEIFQPTSLRFAEEKENNSEGVYDLRTSGKYFGSVVVDFEEGIADTDKVMIQNSVLMLATILERVVLQKELEEEKDLYKLKSEERYQKLEKTITELNSIKMGSLNLINDLTEEIDKRKKIEEQLSESEERILLILNSTAEAIYGLDEKGLCTFCNNACLKYLGYSEPSDLIGRNMHNLIHHTKSDLSPFPVEECEIFKAFKEGKFSHVDTEVMWRKDRTSFPAEYWSYPILREKKIIGSVVTFLDITERKKAEDSLRENQRRQQNYATLLSELIRKGSFSSGDLKDNLKNITEIAAQMLNVERGSIWLYNNDGSEIYCIDLYELSKNKHSSGEILNASTFSGYTKEHKKGEVIAASDVYEDERTREIPKSYFEENNIVSLLDAPVWLHGQLFALLSFEEVGKKREWLAEEKQLATTLSSFVSLAFETEQREKAEAALRESETHIRSINNNLTNGIIYQVVALKDGTRKFTYLSESVEKFYGFTATDGMKDPNILYDRIHPEDADKMKEAENKSLKDLSVFNIEVRVRSISGEYRWSNIISHPKLLEDGSVCYDGIEFDITERKLAEEAIEEKSKLDKQISIIATTAPGAMYTYYHDPNGVPSLPYVSKKWAELTGLNPEASEELVEGLFNVVHPNDRAYLQNTIEHSAKTGEDWRAEFRILHKTEGEKWIEGHSSPTLNEDGSIIWYGFIYDITERKKAEAILRETKEYLENLIKYANAPIIVWDSNFKITQFNVAFEKLTGMRREDVLGNDIEVLFPDEKRESSQDLIVATSKGLQFESVEIEIKNLCGQNKLVLWNSANIFDQKKENIIATIAQGLDITERKEAENKLTELNNKLKILVEGIKSLAEANDLEQIQRNVTKFARLLTDSDGSTLIYKDGDKCYYVEEEMVEPLWKEKRFSLDECISGWVMKNNKAVVIKNIYEDPRVPLKYYENTFVKSLFIVPVTTSETIAAIGCYWKDYCEPSEVDLRLLQTLADSTGRPVENVRLYNELERKVEEKTDQLKERLKELERFYDATINRELRMKELRDEIDELKRKIANED